MKNTRGSALILLLCAVTVLAVLEGIFLIRMHHRLDDLEGEAEGTLIAGNSTADLPERIREVEGLLADTAFDMDLVARATESLERASKDHAAALRDHSAAIERLDLDLRSPSEPGDAPRTGVEPLPGEAIEEVVARTVEAKLRELREKGGGGEWKPTMQELREALSLSEEQTERAEQVLDDGKHEVFQLLTIRRDDGTAKIDDLVEALMDPENAEGKAKHFFTTLFTEKIPGREEPYIVDVLRIRNQVEGDLSGMLDANQKKKLGRMNIDYLGVHTSYDPFAEYVQGSLR